MSKITKTQKKKLFAIGNSLKGAQDSFIKTFKKPLKEIQEALEAIDKILLGKY